jgi:hypothetical protein
LGFIYQDLLPKEGLRLHYKSFRKQYLECKANGNLIKVDASSYAKLFKSFPEVALVCIKYKSVCGSGVCRDERIQTVKEVKL